MGKFVTSKKWLTDYSLSCGYLEVNKGYNTGSPYRFSLGKECGVYHVKGYDERLGRLFWESFDNLISARKFFSGALRDYGCQRRIPVEPEN